MSGLACSSGKFGKTTPNDGRLGRGCWPSGVNLDKGERLKFRNIRPPGQRFGHILHQRKFLRARTPWVQHRLLT